MIVFEECNSEVDTTIDCASKATIDEWLKYKYIVTVENERDFIQHIFEGDPMSEKAEIKWYPISPTFRQDSVNVITR